MLNEKAIEKIKKMDEESKKELGGILIMLSQLTE